MGSVGGTRSFIGRSDSLKSERKQRGLGGSVDSPLAAQLQQAWLQTQLPKRNVPKLDFLSIYPSPDQSVVRSSSNLSHPSSSPFSPDRVDSLHDGFTSQSEVGSYSPERESDSADSETHSNDPLLTYISDMLMEEDLCEKKCMFLECSAHQAMTKELADLISEKDSYPAGDNSQDFGIGELGFADRDSGELDFVDKDSGNSWIDDILNGHPSDAYVDMDARVPSLPTPLLSVSESITEPHCLGVKGFVFDDPYNPYSPSTKVMTRRLKDDEPDRNESYFNSLYPLLMECAQAVAAEDLAEAHGLLRELRERSSPHGNGAQRLGHYVVESLVARISGTGASLYTALSNNRPSATEMLKAYRLFIECSPLPRISHFYGNHTILDAVKGHSRVHIVDFGILYGVQWPCLIWHLSQRTEGPPALRITGIDFPQPGFKATERIEDTGRRLRDYATSAGVEFEFHAIACKWETIQASQLVLRQDEVLVVNCMFRLRNLLDETVMAASPRKILLQKIYSLNPKIFVMGVISAGYNSPFFMSRFREAIAHYSALFEAIHYANPEDGQLRLLVEQEILGRELLNVIACEGTERIERAETFGQWQSRTLNAGFKQEKLSPHVSKKIIDMMSKFHKNFGVAQNGEWLLAGWKDRVIHAMTSWRT